MKIPELTHQNHFQYYYDQKLFGFRNHHSESWRAVYGSTPGPFKNFKQACIEQAQLISQKVNGKIGLLLSGGVDSEVALQSFYEAGVPIKAYIGQMDHDYNIHDISYAIMACEKLSVPYKLIKYDFEKMMESKGNEYANLSQCFSPQLINVMYLIDQFDEYPVIGGGECLSKRDALEGWHLHEKERTASWYKFLFSRNREGCPGFFQYTPDIIYSYMNDPFVREQFSSPTVTESTEFKFAHYSKHFPLRPRKKLTGFEKIQDIDARFRNELKKQFGHCDAVYKTPVQVFQMN